MTLNLTQTQILRENQKKIDIKFVHPTAYNNYSGGIAKKAWCILFRNKEENKKYPKCKNEWDLLRKCFDSNIQLKIQVTARQ